MRLRFVLAAVTLLSAVGMARANTLSTFNLSATLTSGTATGTLILDSTTGKFTDANILVTSTAGSATFTGAPTSSIATTGLSSNVFATSSSPLLSFDLALPLASLKGYAGGSLCTITALCATDSSGVQLLGAADLADVTSGTLTLVPSIPVAATVTPEPPSLLLIGTGVLVLGSFMRRRTV